MVFFNEFLAILRKKEYTSKEVQKYFNRLLKVDKKKQCHNCGKNLNRFMTKIVRRCFCYFCMEYVCDRDCLSDEKFVIARGFNLEYDLSKRSVCSSAAMFLNRRNYLKIRSNNPMIALQDQLF